MDQIDNSFHLARLVESNENHYYYDSELFMQLDVYLIRGRGEKGDKFQLAMVRNADGHYYKGEYDPTQQFANTDELKAVLCEMTKIEQADLILNELNL